MSPTLSAPERGSKRFSAQDWLSLGLVQLVDQGDSGLTLEALCEAAGRTRGSFYHHFQSHDNFVEALMLEWERVYTDHLIDLVLEQDISEWPKTLTGLALRLDHAVEVAVRQFSQRHLIAAEVTQRVDAKRISFLEKLYCEARGVPPATAAHLAHLEYSAFVGTQVVWGESVVERFAEVEPLLSKLVEIYRQAEENT